MTAILRADSIVKRFGTRSVLSGATLHATRCEITFLVGRSGEGKTTLLRIAAGDLAASQGVVFFRGRVYPAPRWATLAERGLYFLPDTTTLCSVLTVHQQLRIVSGRFGTGDLAAAVETCHVGHLLGRRAHELSVGERRRVELSLAMTRRPDCLLADEPLRHVDPIDRSLVMAGLRALAAAGCAVVVSGHDVVDLFALADRVTWVDSGTTLDLGTATDAQEHWRFRKTYLRNQPPARPPMIR